MKYFNNYTYNGNISKLLNNKNLILKPEYYHLHYENNIIK